MRADSLCYSNGSGWQPLPYWAQFLARLGSTIGAEAPPGVRTIAGLALPIRSYAAALAAAGVVAARSTVPVRPSDPYKYFEWLSKLPAGTAVCLTDGNREYKGIFLGFEATPYGPRVGVQVEKKVKGIGGLKRWFPPEASTRIRQLDKEVSVAKLPKKQGGRRVLAEKEVVSKNRFAQHFLDNTDVYEFVISSRLECVIVGHIGLLRQEIKDTVFASRPPQTGELAQGTLQDIIRVRKFSGVNDSYRTGVIYSNSKTLPDHPGNSDPAVAIFDGAASFANWRDSFRSSSWIVLIDRTERLAGEAADLLNSEYLQYRIEVESTLDVRDVPAGVELTVFQEEAG